MDRYGSFRIVAELGRGGMGIVYLGVQDGLERPVAVKVLGSVDDALAARLRHEAAVLADLQHPHIVGVLDVGEVDGRPYLVMPYMPGGTLAEVLRRDGALRPGQVTGVVAAMAEALAAAHARGVLHRDVKPGNVLLSGAGDPYLSDFGIATGSSQTKTSTGELLGTIGYVAPESIAGQPVSAASDLYALGVVAYTALSGRGPVVADSLIAALEAARTGRRTPLDEVAPGTPPELVSLVHAAMSLDPANRPADLRQYARDLRAAVPPEQLEPLPDRAVALLAADSPTSLGSRSASRVAPVEVTRPQPSRRRSAALLPALLVAGLLSAGVVGGLAAADVGPFADASGGGTFPPPPPPSTSPSAGASTSSTPSFGTGGATSPSAQASPDPALVESDEPDPEQLDPKNPGLNNPRPNNPDPKNPDPDRTTPPPPPPNRAPTLAAVTSVTQEELSGVTITLEGRDPEGRALTYAVTALPAGLRLSGNRISGTLSAGAASATTTRKDIRSRSFPVTATVRDDKGATAQRSFTVTVRDTHTSMPNYIGKYGCGSGCGEGGPDVAALTAPVFSCYDDDGTQQPPSTIWRQSIAPGTVVRWGAAAKYWYYEPNGSNCENVARGW